ncbi:8-oxo-dGTP diphosphatase [Secundilactobacillus mixtipabuli]|uniref:DNA mismatch repair protein MutT n=1 Tax=Secundilactobacillus mixtipabuli TaxID=1435342 RepID=A0A1Z5ICW1_9LACO|nr:NUDIX domain-containing protein [Secundilactobacillus mixtipabuli]GAW99643.1 DNA mismatch repair protein MutT [Secundilactobacillus mixtipabuli]
MGINRAQKVELVNMCMVYDSNTKQVLVEDKTDVDWEFGHTFPGGHVEPGEPVANAMIREVFEETGLHISQLEACGCVEWFDQQAGYRKIGFLYRTNHFSGTLKQGDEGRIFWLPLADLNTKNTAESFMEMLAIFTEPTTVSAVSSTMNGQLHLTANQKDD